MDDKTNSPDFDIARTLRLTDITTEPAGIDDLPEVIQDDVRQTYAQVEGLLGATAAGITWRSGPGQVGFYGCAEQLSARPLPSVLWEMPANTITALDTGSTPVPCYVQPLDRVADEFRFYALGVTRTPSRQKAELAGSLARLIIRTVRSTRASIRSLETFVSVGSVSELLAVVLDPGPLPELLGKLAERVAYLTRADSVSIDSYVSDGRMERNVYTRDMSPRSQELNDRWRALVKLRRNQPPVPLQDLPGWRSPLVIPDLQSPLVLGASPREEADFYRDSGLRTVILCPLWVPNEFVGILALSAYEIRDYRPQELDAIERMAAVVAVGIKSLQLYQDLAESTERERAAHLENMARLAWAAEARDPFTGAHLRNIQQRSTNIALVLGCEEDFVRELGIASSLHDIGKIAVPDAVLLKPGPLVTSERELMQRHTTEGERLLSGRFFELARQVARSHHERWDGSGYPDSLAGKDIPLAARIVSIADVYDALTSARPYKSAWPTEEAVCEIESLKGKHFDPEVVEAFVHLYRAGTIC